MFLFFINTLYYKYTIIGIKFDCGVRSLLGHQTNNTKIDRGITGRIS